VASISFTGSRKGKTVEETIENNLNEIMNLLTLASFEKPDIVCLPECAPMLGLSLKEMVEVAEEIPNELFNKISSFAKSHGMYIIFPVVERKGSKVYNSAVVIGRDGEYIGSYHKIHPTIWEIEAGITPGKEAGIFDLDFGRIGILICFDLNFNDVAKSLLEKRPKLVFFPSMYPGGLQLKILAFNCGFYVISAFTGEGSEIVNPLGRTLLASSSFQPVICRDINIDFEILHLDYNSEKMNSIKKKYGSSVNFEVAKKEGVFLMSYESKDKTVEDVIKEFGLETREEYFKRANSIREMALAKSGEGKR